jgi:hypothetical protein
MIQEIQRRMKNNAEYVSEGLMKTLLEMVGHNRRYDKISINYIFLLD